MTLSKGSQSQSNTLVKGGSTSKPYSFPWYMKVPRGFYCETARWYVYKHFSKAPFNTGIENPVLGKIGKD